MSPSVTRPIRSLRTFVGPLVAALALAPYLSTEAMADGGASITGTVSATPARYAGDTVVYIKNVSGSFPASTVLVDQKSMQFSPRIAAVTVGDTVNYGNHDTVAHNVFSPDNEGFNLGTFPPGEQRSYTFRSPNVGYSELCSLHPEMLGYVFVGQNPYHAVVGAGGSFTIKNVPPGTYSVGVWNPKLKAADQSVTVAAGAASTVTFSLAR